MVQPSRTPSGAGNGSVGGGMRIGGGSGAGSGPDERITIEAAAQQLGVAPRTAYDYRRQGKLQYTSERHGQKMRYWTTGAWTEACRLTRARWKNTAGASGAAVVTAPAPPPAVAAVAAAPAVESDRTSLTVARSILGEDAPEDAVEGFAAEVNDYRRHIALLHPQARLLLVREYYSRVKRSARRLGHLGQGFLGGAAAAVVCSVLMAVGTGT